MNILFLSRWFPFPAGNGAKIRIYNLLKGLAENHLVDLAAFYEDEDTRCGIDHLEGFLGEVETVQYKPFAPNSLKSRLGFFSRYPRSVKDTYSQAMSDLIRRMAGRKRYDLVIASEIDVASYGIEINSPVRILEELEVTKSLTAWQQERRPVQKLRRRLAWWKLSTYVRDTLTHYDGVTVVSAEEKAAVLRMVPGRTVQVVPNGVDCDYYRSVEPNNGSASTILYNGAITYEVNFQAVEYFLREIYPLIRARHAQVRFIVSGKNTPELVSRLPVGPGIEFTGFVEDIRTVLSQATLVVTPLLVGGGTRLKILEALAAGLPVVSTSAGVEGLELIPGRDVLVADSPAEFTRAVVSLLEDQALRNLLAQNGRLVAQSCYDWKAINRHFAEYLSGLAV